MAGKKKCQSCGQQVPVAQKVCECGVPFHKGKKCLKCERIVPFATKTCDCNYVFKQRKKAGFQELPVVLTTDRLRPTRPIRLKRPLYNDNDYIYNVSMAALPKQRRGSCGRNFTNERLGKSGYEQDELYDKDLNDAALESIANTMDNSNGAKSLAKTKIEKMYPKRERHTSTKYQYYSSLINRRGKFNSSKRDKQMKDVKNLIVDTTSSDGKVNKVINGTLPLGNGLKKLIRGEVNKALKSKVTCDGTSPIPTINIKEECLSDDESEEASTDSNAINKKVMPKRKNNLSIELKCEDTIESTEKSEPKSDIPKQSNDLQEKGCKEIDISDDEKTLKELKHELSTPKDEVKPEEKPIKIKKKMGRPRIHPITPKKPVGRPRKYPHDLPRKYRKKHAAALLKNLEEIVDLTKDEKSEVNDSLLKTMKKKLSDSPLDKREIKRGRPKGCKDSKPRKIRNDYIERLVARKVDVDGLVSGDPKKQNPKSSKCLLSPPSFISGKKEQQAQNEILDPEEIERIERRLNKTNPFIIPDNKKELYSTILGEINRRISSQSFQSSILIQEL